MSYEPTVEQRIARAVSLLDRRISLLEQVLDSEATARQAIINSSWGCTRCGSTTDNMDWGSCIHSDCPQGLNIVEET